MTFSVCGKFIVLQSNALPVRWLYRELRAAIRWCVITLEIGEYFCYRCNQAIHGCEHVRSNSDLGREDYCSPSYRSDSSSNASYPCPNCGQMNTKDEIDSEGKISRVITTCGVDEGRG